MFVAAVDQERYGGVGFGLVSYVLVKMAAGRTREIHPLIAVFAVLLLSRYIVFR